MEEIQNFQMYMQQMATLPPDYYEGVIKLEDVPQYIAEKMGIPRKLLRTPAEIEKMKQDVAAVQTQQGGALEQPQ